MTLPPPVRLRTVAFPKARAKVKRPAEKARPSVTGAREHPRYPALAAGIARQQGKTALALATLRRRWFAAAGLDDPTKAAKNIAVEDLREIDAAIETFMTIMAGIAPRDRQTFAHQDDAVVQETNILAHRIGTERGAAQVNNPDADAELTRLQRMRLNERAFDRLSEAGRLRFEGGLGTIREGMLEGFNAGENPLVIARELGEAFESYESVWLDRLVRTEMAMASEAAITDQYRAAGVTQFEVIGDPSSDALCAEQIEGGPYELGDEEHVPPFHPNCLCSQSPYVPE